MKAALSGLSAMTRFPQYPRFDSAGTIVFDPVMIAASERSSATKTSWNGEGGGAPSSALAAGARRRREGANSMSSASRLQVRDAEFMRFPLQPAGSQTQDLPRA